MNPKKVLALVLIASALLFSSCKDIEAATYYASPTGSGTECSQLNPGALDYTIATKAGGNDTVVMASGSYGPFSQIDVSKGVILTGPGQSLATITFNAAAHGFYITTTSLVSMSGFTIGAGGDATHRAIYLNGATNSGNVFNDITVDGWLGSPFYATASAVATLNRLTFKNCVTTASTALRFGSSSIVANYCRFLDCGNTVTSNAGCIDNAGGTVALNNPIFVGNQAANTYGIANCSSGTLTINNPIFYANNYTVGVGAYIAKQSSTGVLTINTPLLQGSVIRPPYTTSGTVAVSNAPSSYGPVFKNPGKGEGIVTFVAVDSNHSLPGSGTGEYGTSIEYYSAAFSGLGKHLTYFPDDEDQNTDAQKSILQAFVLAGHDLGVEGKSSSNLSNLVPFTVSYSGAGSNPRIIVSYTSPAVCTLECVTDSGTDLSIAIGKGDTHKYIGERTTQANSVLKAINDLADWTATSNSTDNSFDDLYAYVLTAGTTSVSGTTSINIDPTKYYNEEITNTKSDMESLIRSGGGSLASYSVKSYFYPRYAYSSGAEAVIKSNGFSSALYGKTALQDLASIPSIYALNGVLTEWSYFNNGGTEASIRANANALAGVTYLGKWAIVLLPENSGATSVELGYFISELALRGVRILSMAEAAAYISANYSANGDGFTKSLTYAGDFHLRPSSPCINAGTTIEGLTTDFDGRKVPYSVAPDIGAYEYRPTVGPFRW